MLSVIFCLPCVVCLAWTIIFNIRKCNPMQKLLKWILVFAAFYFMNFALFVAENTDYLWASRCDIVNVFVMPTLMGLLVIYVHSLNAGRMMPLHKRILILVPGLIQTAIIYVLYVIVGVENAAQIFCHEEGYVRHGLVTITQLDNSVFFRNEWEKIFYVFDEFVVTFLVFIYAVVIVVEGLYMSYKRGYHFGDCFRFWFMKRVSFPARSITFSLIGVMVSLAPIIIFGTSFIAKTLWLAIFMSLSVSFWIFLLAYIQFFDNLASYNLHDLTHVDIFEINQNATSLKEEPAQEQQLVSEVEAEPQPMPKSEPEPQPLPEPKAEPQPLPEPKAEPQPTLEPEADEPQVGEKPKNSPTPNLEQFVRNLNLVIDVQQAYKDPNLTRDSLAEKMKSNRTTLSSVLNYSYGMNFKTFIATKRIDHAKELLLANPSASDDYIARECGFKDATAFCHKFKDITGETPKVWVAQQIH